MRLTEGQIAATIVVLVLMSTYVSVAATVMFGSPAELGVLGRIFAIFASVVLISNLSSRTIPRAALVFLMLLFMFVLRLVIDTLVIGNLVRMSNSDYIFWGIGGVMLPCLAVLLARSFDFNFFSRWMFFASCFSVVGFSYYTFEINGLTLQQTYRDIFIEDRAMNPLVLGYGGVVCFSVTFLRFLDTQLLREKLFCFLLMSFSTYIVLFSGSRGPLVTLVFVLIFFLYWRRMFATTFLLVPVLISLLVFLFDFERIAAFRRFLSTQQRLEFGREARVGHVEAVFTLLLESPRNMLLGFGMELPGGSWSHNLFLDAISYFGVLGVGLVIVFCVLLISTAVKAPVADRSLSLICCLAIAHLIMGQFSSSLVFNTGFWICSAVVLTHVRRRMFGTGQAKIVSKDQTRRVA